MHSINGVKKGQQSSLRNSDRSKKAYLGILCGVLFVLSFYYLSGNQSYALKPMDKNVLINSHAKGQLKHVVVFDAGSTGSRVHVFHFDSQNNDLVLLGDDVLRVKPGLGEIKSGPKDAADSLKNLLDYAKKRVPQKLQKETKCYLHATAGLRFLGLKEAQDILDTVQAYLQENSVFQIQKPTLLEGQDEGGFAWITINYLLGNLGSGKNETVSVVDLGGGSVQQAYALNRDQVQNAPSKDYLKEYVIQGKKHDIYVHSWLMYGLNAARFQILNHTMSVGKGSPCIGSDVESEYKYNLNTIKVSGPKQTEAQTSFTNCAREVEGIMGLGLECGMNSTEHCSFNGSWDGGRGEGQKMFYISSYFWDRALDIGIIKDKDVVKFETTPNAFMVAAEKLCQTKQSDFAQEFPDIKDFPEKDRAYLCTDLTYCYTLLTRGFKIDDMRSIYLVKKIDYKGDLVEVAWPLGAALRSFA